VCFPAIWQLARFVLYLFACGGVVQRFSIPACQAGDRGFESRRSRQEKASPQMVRLLSFGRCR
jgi:hypothetical protein